MLTRDSKSGLLENTSWTCNNAIQSRSTNLICDHHNNESFSSIKLGRVRRRIGLGIERLRDVVNAMEEDSIVWSVPLLKDAQMTSFVVANLLHTIIRRVGKTDVGEGRTIEGLNALLVEVENCPFCTEQVLEKKIVWSCGSTLGRQDRTSDISWKWSGSFIVVDIGSRLSGYGP
jgi:hypothetical protein